MNITEDQIILSSSASTRTSLEAIRNKHAIAIIDIAYLAAKTGDEFALLRGKSKDIVFHGVQYHCHIDGELLDLLKTKKLRLIAHTHPDHGEVYPSNDDRDFLTYIGQKTSKIISSITGIEHTFAANPFDDI